MAGESVQNKVQLARLIAALFARRESLYKEIDELDKNIALLKTKQPLFDIQDDLSLAQQEWQLYFIKQQTQSRPSAEVRPNLSRPPVARIHEDVKPEPPQKSVPNPANETTKNTPDSNSAENTKVVKELPLKVQRSVKSPQKRESVTKIEETPAPAPVMTTQVISSSIQKSDSLKQPATITKPPALVPTSKPPVKARSGIPVPASRISTPPRANSGGPVPTDPVERRASISTNRPTPANATNTSSPLITANNATATVASTATTPRVPAKLPSVESRTPISSPAKQSLVLTKENMKIESNDDDHDALPPRASGSQEKLLIPDNVSSPARSHVSRISTYSVESFSTYAPGDKLRVMFEFESLIPVGIKFQAGESVEFVTDVDSQWVKVAKVSDKNISALVPTTYVKGEVEVANVLYVSIL